MWPEGSQANEGEDDDGRTLAGEHDGPTRGPKACTRRAGDPGRARAGSLQRLGRDRPPSRQDAQLPAPAQSGELASPRSTNSSPTSTTTAAPSCRRTRTTRSTGSPRARRPTRPAISRASTSYLEDLAHDSGGAPERRLRGDPVRRRGGPFAELRLALRRRAHRHRPVSGQRLHTGADLPDRRAAPGRADELRQSARTADGPRHTSTSCSRRRKSKTASTAAGRECSAGTHEPGRTAPTTATSPLERRRELIYSNDPYVDGQRRLRRRQPPEREPSDGALQGGLSHEHNESITDPEPNNAWTDFGGNGGENGDKCRMFSDASEFGTPLGRSRNRRATTTR